MNGRIFTKGLAVITAGGLILTGCSTTESRIKDHPDIYGSLSPKDQDLVSHGQIRIGMSLDAAYLAWGSPDQRVKGAMRGQSTETWVYTTTSSYGYGGYGPYWGGPYGWGGGWGGFGGGFAFRSHGGNRFAFFGNPYYDPFYYSYIPTYTYPYKTVTFSNGHAASFQYLVAPYR